ncbi:hypothetical protein ASG31_01905 [Chryseobacterium sp. Leaf404]|uniref:vitamin K epoxide reductase family protein n=1 Tax=unclassified Chryseobacterium TaxID=2593645 RepID=UPI0006F4330C|nr:MULTISPECIES: vitamin K epoxide reductase family protein [unclassified Chryseobacterium]KQT22120.1 hypothetical protein ASG31_01905 [Chryseobacterium sp. Leaf404]
MKFFRKVISNFNLPVEEFRFQFNSHPNYPSALAFSDTLNFLGIKNEAYNLEKEYWVELPDEFITIYKNNFSLVKRSGDLVKVYADQEEQITFEELKNNSTDFILLFEQIKEDKVAVKNNFLHKSIFGIAFLVMLFANAYHWNLGTFVFQILSFAGVYVFYEIFKEKFGKESPILQNFCGVGAKQNSSVDACKTIIQSKDLQLLGLSFSDFGFIYFIGLSVLPLFIAKTSVLFLFISSLAMLSIIYSVYYQISKKSFCKVCGLVIAILILQFVISIFQFQSEFQFFELLVSVFTFIVAFLGVENFSKTIEEKENYRKENIKNLRFKRNYEIFKDQLLKEENKVDFKVSTGGFILRNPTAKLKIAVISNPFCGYCKDAHLCQSDDDCPGGYDLACRLWSPNGDNGNQCLRCVTI